MIALVVLVAPFFGIWMLSAEIYGEGTLEHRMITITGCAIWFAFGFLPLFRRSFSIFSPKPLCVEPLVAPKLNLNSD